MARQDLPIADSVDSPPPDAIYEAAESRVQSVEGERFNDILAILKTEYEPLYCFLDAETPFQLLVAVILSAQCTDEMVNRTTPALFDAYPNPEALATAPRDHIEDLVYSTGFYQRKAEYIQETARTIVDEYDGQVPPSLSALVALPGVARKTATAVLWYAYGRIEGITVDTHVLRLSSRLGFTEASSPDRVEKDLMELAPQAEWPWVTYLFISHGRAICTAPSPDCGACDVNDHCPSAFQFE